MVISLVTRKTRIKEREVWETTLGIVLPKIEAVLQAEAGFLSVGYFWDVHEPGRTAQITRWASEGDCLRYVREGGAATVATIEEAAIPTAPYPDGAWTRQTLAEAG
jgi:hypothetical protein